MNHIEEENQAINRVEKKVWQLMLLAVVIILYLTLSLLGLQFFNFLGESEFIVFSKDSYKFSIFLATLILLFCAYVILQQRKLLKINRAFLEEKETGHRLSQDVKTLSALFDVSSSINSQQKLSDILNTITTEMLVCFHADHSSIMLLDQRSKMLKTMVSVGKGAEFAKDALIPIGKSIAGWVVKSGEPLLLDGQVDPADFPGTPKKERGISSSLCVPLKIGQKSIGVLNINLVDSERTFSKADRKLITIFANNAAVAIHNATLFKDRQQRIRLETLFEQLHSPQIVHELVKKADSWERTNKMREKTEITILFADIRGFSSMMNIVKLEDVLDFLDEFYSVMTKVVHENGGNIDKFIGDEVMAFFGAPKVLKNSGENALNTAIEMVASFKELKEKYSKSSSYFGEMGIGIGVNTGEAFVGNVGSLKRYDYTVIGNAVNLARRLCTMAESGQVLITEESLNKIYGTVSSEFVENISFKGVSDPVNVYKMA